MRYLPLSDADRSEMLHAVGAATIDDLFKDVPRDLLLKEPIAELPPHASELAVERQLGGTLERCWQEDGLNAVVEVPTKRLASSRP